MNDHLKADDGVYTSRPKYGLPVSEQAGFEANHNVVMQGRIAHRDESLLHAIIVGPELKAALDIIDGK